MQKSLNWFYMNNNRHTSANFRQVFYALQQEPRIKNAVSQFSWLNSPNVDLGLDKPPKLCYNALCVEEREVL